MTRLPDQLLEGRDAPMGAQLRDCGVNFVVFSQHATRIELCVFDTSGARELRRYPLHGPHDAVFHGFLPGVGAGLVYGLRAHGPYQPEAGNRFNPHKLLLDPNAREIVGCFAWHAEHHGYALGHPEGTRSFDSRDNAAQALKARVAAPLADPAPRPPRPHLPAAERVLYEVHVKGFSQTHPEIPAALRGTYSALAHPAALAHFKALGVTTLSLLPVQYHVDEAGLAERGLSNYWGYNTLGFFCADPRFALAAHRDDPSAVNDEFRRMVDTLHQSGLEVVLDVVYNHSAEGNESGPTLSFRGLDHASWYHLAGDDKSRCENISGCGNTLDVAQPRVTQFVLDSLRHWVGEMGVDGFRFDLATVLGRNAHGYDSNAAFFTALRQDPLLADTILIAEPWDSGHGGYQLGRFPGRFLEWNDKFRDAARLYWLQRAGDGAANPANPAGAGQHARHAGVGRGEFARRFTASSDFFHHGQRRPSASINFVAAHDGYTLTDLVSYSQKHNLANGEGNRDGRDGEASFNFGVEGPSADTQVNAQRLRVRRAIVATLLLAQGTPMLNAGDEIGNSQQGNNNAYCQDNPLGWLSWAEADSSFLAFVREALALRRAEPALHHDRWFHASADAPGECGLRWLTPEGAQMQVHDWHDSSCHAFACLMSQGPDARPGLGLSGGDSARSGSARLLIAFNPEAQTTNFMLPEGERWQLALDSSGEWPRGFAARGHEPIALAPSSLVVMRSV